MLVNVQSSLKLRTASVGSFGCLVIGEMRIPVGLILVEGKAFSEDVAVERIGEEEGMASRIICDVEGGANTRVLEEVGCEEELAQPPLKGKAINEKVDGILY